MKSAFDQLMVQVIDRPGLTRLLVVLFTGAAVLGYLVPDLFRTLVGRSFVSHAVQSDGDSSADPDGGADPDGAPIPDVDPISLSESDAVIVASSQVFFTPAGAAAMRHVVARLDSLEHVDRILWIDRVPLLNIFGLSEPLFPRSDASAERFSAARDKALKHPLVRGQLLSEDCQTTLLLVTFDLDLIRSDEQCTTVLRETAAAAAAEFPGVAITFQVTGRMPAIITAIRAHEQNQVRYQVIGYGMILAMAVVLFRGFRAVLIVALGPAAGVFWTLGLLEFFRLPDNPFNDVILPVLISLVGFTDGVHLMVQIRRNRAAGMAESAAARTALQDVGWACMLTSLTTAIGMGSLVLAHHRWVREFGWCSVIGVGLTFVSVICIIPLISSTRLGRNLHHGHDKSLIDRNLTRVGSVVEFVLWRARTISVVGIVLTLILTGVSLTLRPDEKRSSALPEHSEARQALQQMDTALGGLEFARIDVHWSRHVSQDAVEILEVVTKVDELLAGEPGAGYPLSIRQLLEALPGEGPLTDRMSLIDLLPPPLKRAFFEPERRLATVNFRLQDLGIATFDPMFQRIQSGLSRISRDHPEFRLVLEGEAVWRWRHLYQIVVDLAASLGSAALIIFVVLGFCYRSLRIGLIAVIPNVFPLAVTGTWLVLSGHSLEIVSVCALTVCLGIAVDDTIHFLTRYQESCETAVSVEDAVRQAFGNVGVAMVMTTVVLVTGFATVASSDSRDHHIFATMGTLTISSALLGDLILLPALLAWFAPKIRQT